MGWDSGGNAQVDFVWGGMPPQPNWERSGVVNPGNGEAEYFLNGHATAVEWDNLGYYPADFLHPSHNLDASDSQANALRWWNAYPDYTPNVGNTLFVDFWVNGIPGAEFPNISGKTLAAALQDLRAIGVAENFLQDAKTDAENPYATGNWLTDSGVVFYRYYAPDDEIGTHWDGSPWLASECEGKVFLTSTFPNCWIGITSYYADGGDYFSSSDPAQAGLTLPWWLSFVVIQTTDPTKNSYEWWD